MTKMTAMMLTVNRNLFELQAANRHTPPYSHRYYRILAKKYLGQLNGEDLILYEAGHEQWLTEDEVTLKALAGILFVEATIVDDHKARYVEWLREQDHPLSPAGRIVPNKPL